MSREYRDWNEYIPSTAKNSDWDNPDLPSGGKTLGKYRDTRREHREEFVSKCMLKLPSEWLEKVLGEEVFRMAQLRVICEQTYRQIADQVGLSDITVARRLYAPRGSAYAKLMYHVARVYKGEV